MMMSLQDVHENVRLGWGSCVVGSTTPAHGARAKFQNVIRVVLVVYCVSPFVFTSIVVWGNGQVASALPGKRLCYRPGWTARGQRGVPLHCNSQPQLCAKL